MSLPIHRKSWRSSSVRAAASSSGQHSKRYAELVCVKRRARKRDVNHESAIRGLHSREGASRQANLEAVLRKTRRTEYWGTMETSASFESRSAPSPYPTTFVQLKSCNPGPVCSFKSWQKATTELKARFARSGPTAGAGSPQEIPLRFSVPLPTEILHQTSYANGLRLAYCVLPFALAVACVGVFLSRRVMASAALNGNWRTDCSPVVLRTTSTRRF